MFWFPVDSADDVMKNYVMKVKKSPDEVREREGGREREFCVI